MPTACVEPAGDTDGRGDGSPLLTGELTGDASSTVGCGAEKTKRGACANAGGSDADAFCAANAMGKDTIDMAPAGAGAVKRRKAGAFEFAAAAVDAALL